MTLGFSRRGAFFRRVTPLLEQRQFLPAVDNCAEEFRGLLRVVEGAVGFPAVPLDACFHHGSCQHGLAVDEPGERNGVEGAEGVEGVALETGTFHCGIEKAEVEEGIVSHQDGAPAIVLFHGLAHRCEDALQGLPFRQRHAKGVPGIDAVELQRLGIEVGAFEGLHVTAHGVAGVEKPRFVHLDDDGGDLKQRIGGGIEPGCLHVHHHGKEAAKTLVDGRMSGSLVHRVEG